MARVQIDLPEAFLYTAELPVRASDVNYGAHLGHDAILTLMQEARIIFYRSLGFASELNFEGTIGQIIADAILQYKSEAFLGDVLLIHIAVTDVTKVSFDMLYRVDNMATGKEVARGKTGIVCFDYDKRKVAAIPASLRTKLVGE